MIATISSCKEQSTNQTVRLITIDPGHFHAALVQKTMHPQIDPLVHIYAPEGTDLNLHLSRIENFNTRAEDPTSWISNVYKGTDFFEQMLSQRKGNVMVTAGNNRLKTDYIKKAVEAGFNVLADKPMVINMQNFEQLKEAFQIAQKNNVLLYDIMSERSGITTILQRQLSQMPEVFGTLEKGTPENPAIVKESVHHFFKQVSGSTLVRPAWYFDVEQQGEGIVDVTVHLVDLVQWKCFPNVILNPNDVKITSAKRWTTNIDAAQFSAVTNLPAFPDYLKKDIVNDTLRVFSNGEINYTLKGVNARVGVIWNYVAPAGGDDTHFSIMRGTKANLIIRQGAEQNYKPILYIEAVEGVNEDDFQTALNESLVKIHETYSGVEFKKIDKGWEAVIPQKYYIGHEAHFGEVVERYLQYLVDGKLPDWEVPNMITKYYTLMQALEKAKAN
jgi:predicted dehydrogenase